MGAYTAGYDEEKIENGIISFIEFTNANKGHFIRFHDMKLYFELVFLIDNLQQNLDNSLENPQNFFKSAILTTQNSVVDALNEKVLNLMPGDTTTLLSADSVETSEQENDEVHQISTEYLQTLNPADFPPAKLILKKGCIIMLLRNLNPEKGLYNGTRLIVKDILAYTLIVVVMHDNGSINEQIEIIPRIQLSTLEYEYPFIFKQFPVKLSFAMTINKSQGQSLANVGIDLRNPAFTHGQIYVALSRSTNLKGIYILHQPKSNSNPEDKIENIIYP